MGGLFPAPFIVMGHSHVPVRDDVNAGVATYFNVGIVEPPDDLNLANPPSNRALLDYLEAKLRELKPD